MSFLTQTYERLEQATELATLRETTAKEHMKDNYDKGARQISYEIGDQVLILKPSTKVKLLGRWQGPATVVRKLSQTTYQVQKSKTNGKLRTYHVNFLQRWESPSVVCLHSVLTEDMEDLPSWETTPGMEEITINRELTRQQHEELLPEQ